MPASILSVDDEPDITDLVRFHLSGAGFHVRCAASGAEALAEVGRAPPDLILLDLMLPDIDGLGVCEILRRQAATATIPIVILTAWTTPEARHLGLDLGALDYLTKPFRPRHLVARVRSLLDRRPHAPQAPVHGKVPPSRTGPRHAARTAASPVGRSGPGPRRGD